MDTQIALKNEKQLSDVFQQADNILKRKYLSDLNQFSLDKLGKDIKVEYTKLGESLNTNVRFFDITQIVINKNENTRDKLVSVFNAVGNTSASILLQIKGTKDKVFIRIGIKGSRSVDSTALAQDVLQNSLIGNFPGTQLTRLKAEELQKCIIEEFSATQTVVTVTDIAGLRYDDETKERQFMQGIEKLIDAMRGKEYTLFLIADPLSLSDLNIGKQSLESIYSQLVPFSEANYTVGINQADTVNTSLSKGVSETMSTSIANTVSHTVGKTTTSTTGHSSTKTDGTSATLTEGTSSTNTLGYSVGIPIPLFIGGIYSNSSGSNRSTSKGESHSVSEGANYSTSYGSNISDTSGTTDTKGQSQSISNTYTEGASKTIGSTESMQVKFENHSVKKLMESIDKTLERYETCADLGMWNCAMYCISDKVTAQMLASIYRSIIRGKNSSLENSAITVWRKEKTSDIMDWLRRMEHPRILVNGFSLTPTSVISSKELALHAGLPNSSIPGLPIIKCAEFGRTVTRYDNLYCALNTDKKKSITLGNIYHMHQEEKLPVELNLNTLASHTFITGSTGSGKSNTIYQILKEAEKYDRKFLVIEPAKGEYKHIFGNRNDVSVYGTNPYKSELLRINPFSFPEDIHVLEHLDRLVEIFNVCWPMYAAMPAVLKKAVELAYIDAGWDLVLSKNSFDRKLLPCFSDVMNNVLKVIDESEYSEENKGNYKGALVTRLKSLTNGINGMIFTNEDISDKDFFDKNVIVDLSRVGSTETKSLIMGILVMKLQEYRMTSGKLNAALSHITVLEEAHNLLKRTSTEQSTEMANLIGKSVEMLANSIAEMRTYGEGFIIADQSPGLLDMSVIRNTNTKIIMRTPDFSDRELVGKAAGLNDDQIIEIGKLPLGVAAVYQNDWIEPVLCKVNHFPVPDNRYEYIAQKYFNNDSLKFRIRLVKYLLSNAVKEKIDEDIDDLKEKILASNILAYDKKNILKLLSLNTLPDTLENLQGLIASLHIDSVKIAISAIEKSDNPRELNHLIAEKIQPNLFEYDEHYQAVILQCIINECAKSKKELSEIPGSWIEFMHHGR
ncbi:ATP-binding protein [Treponema denticola]|uniref:ATP-binding protein n=1 Tax=Treponema denticola TaxID=158 RepID=UPI0020A238FA|nr:ATP-binding protein [Treponema denticola]UTC88106.1 ATP-binding protein [Treponema denticola]